MSKLKDGKDMKNTKDMKTTKDMKEIVARNPFAVLIGMELLQAENGHASARISLKQQLENIYGGMHGGCVFALADTLAGIAAATYGDKVSTLDASINYMRPVKDTQYLYCRADVQRNGSKISVVRTVLTDDEDKLLADGSFTFYHFSNI